LDKGTSIIKATGRKEDNVKTITIRELLTVAVKQIILKEQFSRFGEANNLVEYILDNSTLSVSHNDDVNLKSGNTFGIGDDNKDRELQLPKYCVFSFARAKLADFQSSWVHTETMTHSWRLKSMPDFQKVEEYLRSNSDDNTGIVVLVDAVPMNFTLSKGENSCGDIWVPVPIGIQWEKPVYKLSYKKNGGVYEEVFNSKCALGSRMLQLISSEAERIRAFSLIDDNKHLGFRASGYIYQSGGKSEITDRNTCIIWDNPHYEETEDGCYV